VGIKLRERAKSAANSTLVTAKGRFNRGSHGFLTRFSEIQKAGHRWTQINTDEKAGCFVISDERFREMFFKFTFAICILP
jgi:hypothetical protein